MNRQGLFSVLIIGLFLVFPVNAWSQQLLLPDLPPGQSVAYYGASIAASESTMVVSSPVGRGFIDVYEKANGVWHKSQRLNNPFDDTRLFGGRVAVSRKWLVLTVLSSSGGAPYGYIEIYGKEAGIWSYVGRVLSPASDVMGAGSTRLALSDSALAIGVSRYNLAGSNLDSSVYSMDLPLNGTGFQNVSPPPGARYFGWALAISESLLVVSDPYPDVGTSSISTYTRSSTGWAYHSSMASSSPVISPYVYAERIALCDNWLFATTTARLSAAPAGTTGRVSIYRFGNGQWNSTGRVLTPGDAPDSGFGRELGCDDSLVVVRGNGYGSVHYFQIGDDFSSGISSFYEAMGTGQFPPIPAPSGGDIFLSDSGYGPSATFLPGVVYLNANSSEVLSSNGFDQNLVDGQQ